jgi:D-alanine--poly(phosphoribitol) ligase subunit 1
MQNEYVHNLGCAFYRMADNRPDQPALIYPSGVSITYAALNERSNKIARALLERKIGHHSAVCIFNNKSVDAMASMIACLKVGAVYTNLDVNSPWQRVEKMLSRCRPDLVLVDEAGEEIREGLRDSYDDRTTVLAETRFQDRLTELSGVNLPLTETVKGSDPAYIMFTSGSTGFPKGAVMSHANVLNFIGWARETFHITRDDVLTNVNPIYFDNSVFDLYASLFNGAAVCPIPGEITGRPKDLVACVGMLKCTLWFSVPSLLVYLLATKALCREDFSAMRTIVFGGEGFPKSKLSELYGLFGDRIRLVNVYGPTECTCICSSYPITADDVKNVNDLAPLGFLARNFGFHIAPMEGDGTGCGELYLSGPNVGLGYYNDPDRTRDAFVQHPNHTQYRDIVYRTGDLVQLDEEGRLHFKGRVDNQIKHMGYRIELEEIEAALNSLGYVHEAAVVYKRGKEGPGHIVAFVHGADQVGEKQIRRDLTTLLPPYMVPRDVIVTGMLPRNVNGKVDRVSLRALA